MISKSTGKLVMMLPILGLLLMLGACTISPKGETRLRTEAQKEGRIYNFGSHRINDRPLPLQPDAADLVAYALRHSPKVEAAYWKFRAAIENIPQAGSEMTTPMLSGNLGLQNGTVSAANSSIGIANMGSSDIRWPSKPAAEAKIALENARNAQSRFREAQLILRRQVLTAWYGLITTRELSRDARQKMSVERALKQDQQLHIESASGSASGYLSVQNAMTNLRIKLAQLERMAAAQQVKLNLLLNRAPHRSILTPSNLALTNWRIPSLAQIIKLALEHNPTLRALHFTQQQTRFSQTVFPPKDRGITWSSESSLVGSLLRQYWQVLLSRA